jgi:hypothetical protein
MCRDISLVRPATIRFSLMTVAYLNLPSAASCGIFIVCAGRLPKLIDDLRIEHRRIEASRLQP